MRMYPEYRVVEYASVLQPKYYCLSYTDSELKLLTPTEKIYLHIEDMINEAELAGSKQ